MLCMFLSTLATVGRPPSPASAQTQPQPTYWLGRSAGTEYVFETPLPADFAAMLTCSDAKKYAKVKDLCKSSSQVIDGKTYSFVTTEVSWDKDAIDKGTISFVRNGTLGAAWFNMDANSAEWKAVTSQVKAQATVASADGAWKRASLLVLIWSNAGTPTVSLPIPEMTQIKTKMNDLGKQVKAGLYYTKTVKIPADLDAFRAQMLAYGNAGRRDPDFRKNNGAKTAADLSGDTVITKDDKGQSHTEKVFKQSKTAPYFPDHVLNNELNQAAQFQAEYQASINKLGHDGPGSYINPKTGKSITMAGIGDRVKFFSGPANVVEAAGVGGLDNFPHGWMAGDTHFRPWFNVDGAYPEIGYGAAMSANGTWYFVAVAIRDTNPIVAAVDPKLQLQKDYGFLYNAYVAKSAANVCPTGWKVPAQADFQVLVDNLKSDVHLKLSDPAFWGTGNKATNASGFSARPAGGFGGDTPGGSYDFGKVAHFWSTTERAEGGNYLLLIHGADAGTGAVAGLRYGFSIRCISGQAATGASATSVKDADGNSYKTVKIGQQLWMAENLRTTKFFDGTSIPLVSDKAQWVKLDSAAYTLISPPPAGN